MGGRQDEPGLLRKLVEIWWEQARRRRALRQMARATWSFDFLCALLVRSAKAERDGVVMEIVNRDGQRVRLTYDRALASGARERLDDSILDRLDDDAAVADFIRRNGRR